MAAHDFASKKKKPPQSKSDPKKKPAGESVESAKNNVKKPSASKKQEIPTVKTTKKVPAIIWIIIGISVALLGQYAYKQYKSEISLVINESIAPKINQLTSSPKDQQKSESDKTPRFEFYTLLKHNDVEIKSKPNTVSAKPKYSYLVQAGSFRNKSDAEKMRSKLILNNLTNTKTDSITTSNGTWYRVNVGPFYNRSKLEKARDILAGMNIQSLVKKKPIK